VPTRTLPLPEVDPERRAAFDEIARRTFQVLRGADASSLLLDDDALRALLTPEAATRVASIRASTGVAFRMQRETSDALAHASYLGVCIQRARLEPPGTSLAMRAPGFAFDRMLVVGSEPGGGRVAAWVEGSFVYTDAGFYALVLNRLEAPRRDHADLDLAPCDLRFGLGSPRGVVVSAPASY
jgi:hypothetical protein